MSSSSKGKFCSHCQKTVIDFRQMSDTEIAAFMYAHKGQKICGAISFSQKDKKYEFVQPQKIGSPVKRYIMAVLAGLITTFPSQVKAINFVSNSFITQYEFMEKDTSIKEGDFPKKISGKLINKENGQAISNVIVRIDIEKIINIYLESELQSLRKANAEEQVYKEINNKKLWFLQKLREQDLTQFETITDDKGYFCFNLVEDFPKCELILTFTFIYNQVKNNEGKELEGQIYAINDYWFYYKEEKQVLEIKTSILKKEVLIIEEPYMIGEMPYEE